MIAAGITQNLIVYASEAKIVTATINLAILTILRTIPERAGMIILPRSRRLIFIWVPGNKV